MQSAKKYGEDFAASRAISDGETTYSGLTDNTRKIVGAAASITAMRVLDETRAMLQDLLHGEDLGDDAYDRGYKAALRQALGKVTDAYPWQVVATQNENDPVSIIDVAHTRSAAQQIVDRWNRTNGSVATYSVEEA